MRPHRERRFVYPVIRPARVPVALPKGDVMAHPVVHVEIRSQDPDATREFFGALFGWKVASEGAFPGYTFIASMSSVIFSRAVPVLAEIDRTFNLDPQDVEAKITPRTKAIMVDTMPQATMMVAIHLRVPTLSSMTLLGI